MEKLKKIRIYNNDGSYHYMALNKSEIRIFDKYHFHHFTVHRVICKHNEVDSVKYNGDWYKVLESYDDKGDYFYIICEKWDEWYCVHSNKSEDYYRKGCQ